MTSVSAKGDGHHLWRKAVGTGGGLFVGGGDGVGVGEPVSGDAFDWSPHHGRKRWCRR